MTEIAINPPIKKIATLKLPVRVDRKPVKMGETIAATPKEKFMMPMLVLTRSSAKSAFTIPRTAPGILLNPKPNDKNTMAEKIEW